MCPERSVIMSLISDLPGDCWKTGVGRVAVDFGAGQGAKRRAISAAIWAKRATQASAKINATLEGARQKGSWLRRSLVTAPVGMRLACSLPSACPASTRDPFHFFKNLLSRLRRCGWSPDDAPGAQALDFFRVEPEFLENFVVVFSQLRRAL